MSAKVLVFTVAYNAQNTIGRTIESILNQTYRNFEYYVLDNASTDNTEEVILEYADRDERIVALHVNKNDPPNGTAFFRTLVHASDARYIVWCDADDAYTPNFLENMVAFAEENDLDIASCGYDKVDGLTGELLKRRVIQESMIIQGDDFKDKFIQYRGFMLFFWGKIYSIPFLKREQLAETVRENRNCNDSIWVMKVFRRAKKAGVFPESMYQYFQYPGSLSKINIGVSQVSYREFWQKTKEYLEGYGPISKLNEDFLYAIHLSFVEEQTEKIFTSELCTEEKLELLEEVFADTVWKDTMKRNADAQFLNLKDRGRFVKRIMDLTEKLPRIEEFNERKKHLFLQMGGDVWKDENI